MRLNADFSHFACVTPEQYHWVASPSAGVERMMLDRIGDEVARATSLVRYAPNSQFSHHTHDGGEEILVLEGVFADEHGRYSAGSYLRNPIGTGHTPQIGEEGALILVKLHQFDENDLLQLAIPAHRLPCSLTVGRALPTKCCTPLAMSGSAWSVGRAIPPSTTLPCPEA